MIKKPGGACIFAALTFTATAMFSSASAETFSILYTFSGGIDGGQPVSDLVTDGSGNLYGTTYGGGSTPCECGIIFKLAPDGTETVIHSFKGGKQGAFPYGGAIRDGHGNFYGTTYLGGTHNYGIVYKVAADGTFTNLHSFAGGADGAYPQSGLFKAANGLVYGQTPYGGGAGCYGGYGCGTIYQVARSGSFGILHSFSGSDGDGPLSNLISDKAGNLYGTASGGGANDCGTIFTVAPKGAFRLLYSFTCGNDGIGPIAGLVRDAAGNLYGTTNAEYVYTGTAFELTSNDTLTVLHDFTGPDGQLVRAGLVRDSKGNLYGTASAGGYYYSGTLFKISSSGTFSVIHNFNGKSDGGWPGWTLLKGAHGYFYGTAHEGGVGSGCGGAGCGTVFSVKP